MRVGMVGRGMKDVASGVLVLGVAATESGGVLEVDWAVRRGDVLDEAGRLGTCPAAAGVVEMGGVAGLV